MRTLHLFLVVLAGLAFSAAGAPAQIRPVVAVFEPDASDLGRMPLPNQYLTRAGRNHLPGATGAVQSVNALSGFSTAAPIYVPFDGTVDPRTVTEQSAVVVNAETGEVARVMRDVVTFQDGASVIRMEPMAPLHPSSRYLVFVTDDVRSAAGDRVRASAFVEGMRDGEASPNPSTEARRREYEDIWRFARQRLQLEPPGIVSAFGFTTQPIGKVLPVMRARVQKLTPSCTVTESAVTPDAVAALFTKWGAADFGYANVGMVFKGTLTTPRYVADYSRTPMRFAGPDDPVQVGTVDVPFIATIPAKGSAPFPVLVFQHGSYRDKTDLLRIADAAARAGGAVIGIDAALHGERAAVIDGVLQHSGTNLINLERPIMLRDNWLQSYSDIFALVRAVRLGNTRFTGGAPMLETGRVAYMGHSMGALMGGVVSATEPDVAVSVLNVPGGKIRTLLTASEWFAPRFNAEMARRGVHPVTPEHERFLWMYQTAADDADPFNYGPMLRALGAEAPQVLIQEMGEFVMPNQATEDLARSLGLRQVHPVRPVEGLLQAGWPYYGSALFQFPGGGHNTIINLAEGPTASVQEQATRFVLTGLKGKAEVIRPEIPVPDFRLNMPAAPGQ